jgi:hypothetical protein
MAQPDARRTDRFLKMADVAEDFDAAVNRRRTVFVKPRP